MELELLPTAQAISQLPIRAQVALAARCARRVEPLYRDVRIRVSATQLRVLLRALEAPERLASGEGAATIFFVHKPTAPSPETSIIRRLALRARSISEKLRDLNTDELEAVAPAVWAARTVACAADAADFAAHHNADSDPSIADAVHKAGEAALHAAGAVQSAVTLINNTDGSLGHKVFDGIMADWQRLQNRLAKFTKGTAFPASVFGTLWPGASPFDEFVAAANRKLSRQSSVWAFRAGDPVGHRRGLGIELELTFPDDMSTTDIAIATARVVELASKIHRVHGGNGLVIDSIGAEAPAMVEATV